MKFKKLAVAMAALSAISAGHVVASDTEDKMQVNLSLRTFYMNRDFDMGIPDTIAAGQAFRAEFLSPFWNDMIGVDASVVHVAKLEGDKTINSSDVLTTGGDGYTTLEQAYVKIKPTDNVNIRAGRMILMTPLLNDLTSRISAPSTQAIHATAKFGNGELYGIYSDKASMNNSEDFVSYNANGEDYEVVSVGNGTYLSFLG